MLLVIDVGNTNTVLGVYEGRNLVANWRVRTEQNMTTDEFSVLAVNLFSQKNICTDKINKTVITCVVPLILPVLDSFCDKYLGHKPHVVGTNSWPSLKILYNNPLEVGADRIVNAISAYAKYKTSLIVIDFGTATTFDCISEKGEYLGGAISPGIMIAAEALYTKTSKLPKIEIFKPPEKVIGKDTISSIKSGVIYGYAGLVDGMVKRMKIEMNVNPKVVATGGLSTLMANVSNAIDVVEPLLTLVGLQIIGNSL